MSPILAGYRWDNEWSPARRRRQYAMIPDQVKSGRRHKRSKLFNQFNAVKHHVAGAIAPAALELVQELAGGLTRSQVRDRMENLLRLRNPSVTPSQCERAMEAFAAHFKQQAAARPALLAAYQQALQVFGLAEPYTLPEIDRRYEVLITGAAAQRSKEYRRIIDEARDTLIDERFEQTYGNPVTAAAGNPRVTPFPGRDL